MAILRHYIAGDEQATFLEIEIEHSDKPETATFRFRYRAKHSSEILRSSFLCDNDCSMSWFMGLASALRRADTIQEALSDVAPRQIQGWQPVMWSRTDCITVLVLKDRIKSPPKRCLVHVFLRPLEDHEQYIFFVIRPSVDGLIEFGRQFFDELAAVPGFDPELVEDLNRSWSVPGGSDDGD
jgi:hypothetical protein